MIKYKDYVFQLIRNLMPQLVIVIILFISGIALGFSNILNINDSLDSAIGDFVNKFKDFRGYELFIRILINNSSVTAIALFGGIMLSIIPTLSAIMNGILVGFVLQKIKYATGVSLCEVILYMVPHGIFEIPAFILSLALGIKMGGWLFNKNKIERLKLNFKESLKCFCIVIIPLLIIAAAIETIGIEMIHYFNPAT